MAQLSERRIAIVLSGRRLVATVVLAVTIGFVAGWFAHRPPAAPETAALLQAFEQVNQRASQVISDAMRAGAAGPAPGAAR